jgi:hypothetical protein
LLHKKSCNAMVKDLNFKSASEGFKSSHLHFMEMTQVAYLGLFFEWASQVRLVRLVRLPRFI